MTRIATGLLAAVTFGGVAAADEFGDYWYRGLAELTSYELSQARYGEVHPGHAVLIYVTEDFSRTKQVKLDSPRAGDAVKVLKLNLTKKFDTGIYPYSMMSSVFTPVDSGKTLKVTTSSQEWCGHTFTQLNLAGDDYRARLQSYFESEGDRELTLRGAQTEDGIWNRIRLAPDALPRGELQLVPGTMYVRLRHVDLRAYRALASLKAAADDPAMRVYTLTYPELDRTLSIRFRAAFPHEIEGWEENTGELTTRATRNERLMLDYWRRHGLEDVHYRKQLGLE